jgi:hypothetical protein
MQLVPGIVLGLVYAVVVFVIAQKRKINPWGWTIATLVPLLGLLVAAVFFIVTLLSILDRLDTLEARSRSVGPSLASNKDTEKTEVGAETKAR